MNRCDGLGIDWMFEAIALLCRAIRALDLRCGAIGALALLCGAIALLDRAIGALALLYVGRLRYWTERSGRSLYYAERSGRSPYDAADPDTTDFGRRALFGLSCGIAFVQGLSETFGLKTNLGSAGEVPNLIAPLSL